MTVAELVAWLLGHGWTVSSSSDVEVFAEHPERGGRRFSLRTTQGKLVGDATSYWRVERLRKRETGPT